MKLIADFDLSTSEKRVAFKTWQWRDGTIEGLKELIGVNDDN